MHMLLMVVLRSCQYAGALQAGGEMAYAAHKYKARKENCMTRFSSPKTKELIQMLKRACNMP